MIIGIDATQANKPHKTGVEWYAYHLIRELTKLPTKHTWRLYFNCQPQTNLQNLGARVEAVILPWPLPRLWTQLRLSWELLRRPPDLFFAPAQIVPFMHPPKTITTIHDLAFKVYPEDYRLRSRWYLNLAARWASRLPGILTVSEFSKREIIKFLGLKSERITVTHLGLTPRPQSGTTSSATSVTTPYLLYIGRLEQKKNIDDIVQILETVKERTWGRDFSLVLVGPTGFGWPRIAQRIAMSKCTSSIKVQGWISEQEKSDLLAKAEALILVSDYEGFGLPIIEALASGCPVITTAPGAVAEIVAGAGLIVPPKNPAAAVDAIAKLRQNPDERHRLIVAGRLRAQNYTWQKTAEATLRTMERILNS